jgi:hypothetical protein
MLLLELLARLDPPVKYAPYPITVRRRRSSSLLKIEGYIQGKLAAIEQSIPIQTGTQFPFSIPISLSQSPRRNCHVVATGDGFLVFGLMPKPWPPDA